MLRAVAQSGQIHRRSPFSGVLGLKLMRRRAVGRSDENGEYAAPPRLKQSNSIAAASATMRVRASTAVLLLALVAVTLNRVSAYPLIAEIDEDDETVSRESTENQAHLAAHKHIRWIGAGHVTWNESGILASDLFLNPYSLWSYFSLIVSMRCAWRSIFSVCTCFCVD